MCSHVDTQTFTWPAMNYISTDFDVDSSNHFQFRLGTVKLTDATDYPTQAAATTGIGGNHHISILQVGIYCECCHSQFAFTVYLSVTV